MTPPAESTLEITISPRKMPPRARNAVLLALAAALAIFITVFAWFMAPRGLLSILIGVPFVVMAVAVVGLYMAGILIETSLRIDQVGIHARQWRFVKELPFAQIKRFYLFRDGRQDKLAIVPIKESVWFTVSDCPKQSSMPGAHAWTGWPGRAGSSSYGTSRLPKS